MLPDMFLLPWSQYTVACTLLGYLCLVRLFRRKRYEEVHSKYAHKIHELTPQEAQNVMLLSSLWDMPGLYNYAVSFALFKTYAIASILLLFYRISLNHLCDSHQFLGFCCKRMNWGPLQISRSATPMLVLISF
jgi:hypothetical protein